MAQPSPGNIRYRALAIDTDMGARMRLKQAAQSVHTFKGIVLLSTLEEAFSKVEESNCDVVFISERIPEADLLPFVRKVKGAENGKDTAFVLLLAATEEGSTKAAKSVLDGFDGCLAEPYSVDALTEITVLTAQVKKDRREEREKDAIDYILNNIMRRLDQIAIIKSCDMELGATMKRLKESCDVFETFDEETLDMYFREAIEAFEKAKPNEAAGIKANYKGVSQRVKKNIVKKLIVDAEKEFDKSKVKI